ncbi:MAG: 2Fe-2S iron-sulfur cluster binding domain-containing protein [Chlorobi bacterium]|nr:2Fe-2S iron-sulfur cluster binding domain-containing protein [Chlorobiota bacterium]
MQKITFILNNENIFADVKPNSTLLDFIRKKERLTGTKEVCKEGDCGACSVLIGELENGIVRYKNVTSCIYPIANAEGKHVVTIEGLNQNSLNKIQEFYVGENAAQCGFCTPGFIVSTAEYFLNNNERNVEKVYDSISGNICRCTGYGSIKRAAEKLVADVPEAPEDYGERLKFLIEKKIIPEYFLSIKDKLQNILQTKKIDADGAKGKTIVAGGTDLFVQRADEMLNEEGYFVKNFAKKFISEENGSVILSGATTFEDFFNSEIIKTAIPNIHKAFKLIASQAVRNSATLAGNIVNASPIGDMTIILLALNAKLILKGKREREIALKDFYLDYKKVDKANDEIIEKIIFEKPGRGFRFNFEKVSKRTHLDIASVNTAFAAFADDGIIRSATLSAGGIAPIPKVLEEATEFLSGKEINNALLNEVVEIANSVISPISDVRGSADYKRLLLGQLIKAHFIELFSDRLNVGEAI